MVFHIGDAWENVSACGVREEHCAFESAGASIRKGCDAQELWNGGKSPHCIQSSAGACPTPERGIALFPRCGPIEMGYAHPDDAGSVFEVWERVWSSFRGTRSPINSCGRSEFAAPAEVRRHVHRAHGVSCGLLLYAFDQTFYCDGGILVLGSDVSL